jgi:hypothetical protein
VGYYYYQVGGGRKEGRRGRRGRREEEGPYLDTVPSLSVDWVYTLHWVKSFITIAEFCKSC